MNTNGCIQVPTYRPLGYWWRKRAEIRRIERKADRAFAQELAQVSASKQADYFNILVNFLVKSSLENHLKLQ